MNARAVPFAGSPPVMVPPSDVIRRRMEALRRKDTDPELAIQSELVRMGVRFQTDTRPDTVRSRADLVVVDARLAIYIDGCYWHACPDHGTVPKRNTAWWVAKLEANQQRDLRVTAQLEAAGWAVLRIWEHEDVAMAADRIRSAAVSRGVVRD